MLSNTIQLSKNVKYMVRSPKYFSSIHLGNNTSRQLRGNAYFHHNSSASVSPNVKLKGALKRKSRLSPTEIIEVKENSSSCNSGTKITRLKASQLHKVSKSVDKHAKSSSSSKEKEKLDHSINISNVSSNDTLGLSNEHELLPSEELVDIESLWDTSPDLPLKKSNRKDSLAVETYKSLLNDKASRLLEEVRWRGRNQSFNLSLAAFISVSVYVGHYNSAYNTFFYYLKDESNSSKNTKQLTIDPYNAILKGLASQGDYARLIQVIDALKKSKLKPNLDTFAYILASLGMQETSDDIQANIKSTLQWMEENNVKIEDLFLLASFPRKSLENCFNAVKSVNSHDMQSCFKYKKMENFLNINNYDNPLVDKLNSALFTNKVPSPCEGVLSHDELKSNIEKQIQNEIDGYIEVPNVYKQNSVTTSERNNQLFKKWEDHWRKSLMSALASQKRFMENNFVRKVRGLDFYPYFAALDDEDIVNIMMTEIRRLGMGSNYYSPTLNLLAFDLGNAFYSRFLLKYKEKTDYISSLRKIYDEYCEWYLDPSSPESSYMPRVEWNRIIQKNIEKINLRDCPPEWPYTLKLSIGKLLYNVILSQVVVWKENDTVEDAVPAFYKLHRTSDMKIRDEIKSSPIFIELFNGASTKTLTFQTNTMPMIAPPIPWTSTEYGGYFISKSEFVRMVRHAQEQKKRMALANSKKMLFPVMDSLNQLGSIPWRINKRMLDLLIQVFNQNGWEKMDICVHPSSLKKPAPITSKVSSSSEKKEMYKSLSKYKKEWNELNSLWHSMLYKLSIANYYRDDIIWLPQNMDFRGRTYPVPPHLTHLSSDVFRSILNFAQGKKLGSIGLFWLKLHIINLTGFRKRSCIEDRMSFFQEVESEILDSADNPLDGRMWWTDSDEPWQTLAACMEYAAAIRSGCPEEFISHLPVHQDGSCNGLQHYAALGRDKHGARSVNLSPSDTPQDVYSDVVELVERARKADAEAGLPIAQTLEGVISRKIIKQTVMTNVYGVTRFGARLQIFKQLNYLEDFPEKQLFSASAYLARKTFESLGTIFSATKEIQDWLSKLAIGISKECLQNVEWVTPLGFPVVQPYNKNINNHVIPGVVLATVNDDGILKPNLLKQKNAFPPNYIHSLDSSHMMLTSLFCQFEGISFVSIHDCFWTHASSVPVMNKVCREQFIALHSQPILENLARFFEEKYSHHERFETNFCLISSKADVTDSSNFVSMKSLLQHVPQKGEFDINEVMESVFFFS